MNDSKQFNNDLYVIGNKEEHENMLEHCLTNLIIYNADCVLSIIELEKKMDTAQSCDEYCTYLSQWYKVKSKLCRCKRDMEKCKTALQKLKGE